VHKAISRYALHPSGLDFSLRAGRINVMGKKNLVRNISSTITEIFQVHNVGLSLYLQELFSSAREMEVVGSVGGTIPSESVQSLFLAR